MDERISRNIGSKTFKRLDYTAIGDIVNVAKKRLQSIAKNGQIIICEEACRKVMQSFNCRLLRPEPLRNKASEVVVQKVVNGHKND